MARQPRTREPKQTKVRSLVKCRTCGTETRTPMLRLLKGVAVWVCPLCSSRHANVDGS